LKKNGDSIILVLLVAAMNVTKRLSDVVQIADMASARTTSLSTSTHLVQKSK